MYRDKKLRKLMDMYAIMESASSCEFTITKPPPQSAKMTKFGRKKALGEALARKKVVKENVPEEEFLNGMFDKFVANRNVQEGAIIRALYNAAFKKRDEKGMPTKPAFKRPVQRTNRTSSVFGVNR